MKLTIPAALLALLASAGGCGGRSSEHANTSSPAIRSAEHDARDAQAGGEPIYTAPNGRPIAPEPQDPEPNHGTPGSQDATGGKVDVPIRERRFTPQHITVAVGQIVVFTDDDDVPHTVWNVHGGLPHSGVIPVGGRFEFTPLVPGLVVYHCVIHPQMRGELVVVSRQTPHHKPRCSDLSRSARHELGDTGSEMETHCVRDR